MIRRLLICITMLLCIVFSGVFAYHLLHKETGTIAAHITIPLVIFSAPDLYTDDMVTYDDLRGKHYKLVNVFGSWCVSCLAEHALLMKLANQYKIDIIGINWRDSPQKAKAWLEKHGNPYTKIAQDPEGDIVIKLGVKGAPETFLVNSLGELLYKWQGPLTEAIIEEELLPAMSMP